MFQRKYLTKNGRFVFASCAVGFAFCASSVSAGNTTYQYDALGRVVKVTYPDSKQICYQYDDAGNRIKVQKQATGTCTPKATILVSNSVATLQAEESAMFGAGGMESAILSQSSLSEEAVTAPSSSDTQ